MDIYIYRSKKQTAYDLCELLLLVFENIQKKNLTSTMEFVEGGWLLELQNTIALHLPPSKFHKLNLVGGVVSRIVKYYGFAFPPPSENSIN